MTIHKVLCPRIIKRSFVYSVRFGSPHYIVSRRDWTRSFFFYSCDRILTFLFINTTKEVVSLDSQFKACVYRVNKFTLDINGNSTEIDPQYVSEIVIEKPYDTMCLPYFEVTITIPNNTMREMQKENVETRCYINLQKAYDEIKMSGSGDDNTIEGESQVNHDNLAWEDAIEGNFYVMSDDGSVATNSKEIEEYEERESDSMSDLSNMASTRIALYNEEYLFNSKTTVNGVMQAAKPIDVVAWICNKASLNKIVCSPPSVEEEYEQIVVPPYGAAKAISWVTNNYNTNDCGTLVFFDLDRGYILNKNAKCTAWEAGDVQRTIIESVQNESDSYGSCCGCFNSGEEFHVNLEENSMHFSTPSVVSTQTVGSSMLVVDSDTGEKNTYDTGATTTASGENTKVYSNKNGTSNGDALAMSVKEASKQATCEFTAVDIDAFKPNIEISLSFTDADLSDKSGSYRISDLKCVMSKNADILIPVVSVTLLGGYEETTTTA